MSLTIALAGNPNCGKTTLFNKLTGSNQYVGNWPGVTVEKKEGRLKGHKNITITDLPGVYSLSPYTLEEVVARNYLIEEKPDAILNIVDGTNLERSLYLTTQLLELNIPTILAINMLDLLDKRGDVLNLEELSKHIGCKVIEISALKGDGIDILIDTLSNISSITSTPVHNFNQHIEDAITYIQDLIYDVDDNLKRFYAIKLFERDEKLSPNIKCLEDISSIIENLEKELDNDSESIITNERYIYLSKIISTCFKKTSSNYTLSTSDKIDKIVTNRWLGIPIFALIMCIVYYISITTVGTIVTDWTNNILFGEIITPTATSFLINIDCAPWLIGLIVDGIIGGVGAVLGFVPQMLILFALLSFLEACGYMARVAFIMDKYFSKFGLSGKSFIPIIIGTGCGVPGIMASRTIENDKNRKITIFTTTFIPCSAKLPIIAFIAGAMFDGAAWVAASAYFLGILTIICSGIILKKTKAFTSSFVPFIMELPDYHLPSAGNIFRSTWERGWSFIKKAGTVILLSTIIIWFLLNFSFNGGFHMITNDLEKNVSILAYIGKSFAWIFTPLGFGNWKAAVATITGLVAKEEVVGTFGILYGFTEVAEDGTEVWAQLQAAYSPAAAYSFLVFNLLCAPCVAAIGAIKRELNNTKWCLGAVAYQTGVAYIVSFIIYQMWMLVVYNNFTILSLISILLIISIIYLLLKPNKYNKA